MGARCRAAGLTVKSSSVGARYGVFVQPPASTARGRSPLIGGSSIAIAHLGHFTLPPSRLFKL